jgi:hypothetical protein
MVRAKKTARDLPEERTRPSVNQHETQGGLGLTKHTNPKQHVERDRIRTCPPVPTLTDDDDRSRPRRQQDEPFKKQNDAQTKLKTNLPDIRLAIRRQPLDEEGKTREYIAQRCQTCISCNYIIDISDSVVVKVSCPLCQATWCKMCQEKWTLHGAQTGGLSSCNRVARKQDDDDDDNDESVNSSDLSEEAYQAQVDKVFREHWENIRKRKNV